MAFSDNLEAPDAVSGANCASAEQARLYPVRPEIFFRDQQFDGPSRSLRVALDHLFLETLENRNHGYQYVIQNGYRDHRGSVTSVCRPPVVLHGELGRLLTLITAE